VGFGLVIGFIDRVQVVTKNKFHTLAGFHATDHTTLNLHRVLSLVFAIRFLATYLSQELSLQITMKSSCHFLFRHRGLLSLQNSTQLSNSNSLFSLATNGLSSCSLGSDPMENTVFSSWVLLCYLATNCSTVHGEHSSYYCVFLERVLSRCLAVGRYVTVRYIHLICRYVSFYFDTASIQVGPRDPLGGWTISLLTHAPYCALGTSVQPLCAVFVTDRYTCRPQQNTALVSFKVIDDHNIRTATALTVYMIYCFIDVKHAPVRNIASYT
jgi:hypothetical protein